jgi:hypothetical protein
LGNYCRLTQRGWVDLGLRRNDQSQGAKQSLLQMHITTTEGALLFTLTKS